MGILRAVLIAALAALVGCDQNPKSTADAPPPGVLVAKVQNRAISETVVYVGRTVAVNDVSLRARVEGYLLERRFEEGDDIEQGTELFVIDQALYAASLAAADGSVAQANAELVRANKDLRRYMELIKKQSISRQKLDEAESDKLQAEANLKSAQATQLKAQIDLAHTVIKAPISVGDLVTPQSEELARLVELDPIYANFSVSERDVIAAKRRYRLADEASDLSRLEVRLRLPDGSDYEHVGRLDFIDNVVDRKTGTVVLRAKFDNPDKLLVPGLYVSTMLGREETTDKLVIPQSAVQEDQAGVFVMVVGPDNKVEQRRIQVGQAFAGELVVKSDLDPDEQVIVEGIQKVRPGLLVNPKIAPRPSIEKRDKKEFPPAAAAQTTASSEAVESEPEAATRAGSSTEQEQSGKTEPESSDGDLKER